MLQGDVFLKVLENKRQINLLIALGGMVYFFSYLTRVNYAAIIVELVSLEKVTKPEAAVVTTVAFITYGVGQLLSGYIGDRISPRQLIFGGFALTVSMNFLLPVVSDSVFLMAVVWGINGVAQAFMWPPLVKILSSSLSGEDYSRAMPFVAMGSAGATVAVYLFSPFIIRFLDWRYVFYIFAALAFAAAVIWLTVTKKLLANIEIITPKKSKGEKVKNSYTAYLMKLLPVIMLTIAIQGILRDGIATWFPTFMSENFKMGSENSILTAVALPIFHTVSSFIVYRVLLIFKNNVFKAITFYFVLMAVVMAVLYLLGMNSVVISLVSISLSSGIIHSVNCLQTSYIPRYFADTGSVSAISGLLNFSTYIGSALSTYLFAVISDLFGWSTTVFSWVIVAVAGVVMSIIIQKLSGKKNNI